MEFWCRGKVEGEDRAMGIVEFLGGWWGVRERGDRPLELGSGKNHLQYVTCYWSQGASCTKHNAMYIKRRLKTYVTGSFMTH